MDCVLVRPIRHAGNMDHQGGWKQSREIDVNGRSADVRSCLVAGRTTGGVRFQVRRQGRDFRGKRARWRSSQAYERSARAVFALLVSRWEVYLLSIGQRIEVGDLEDSGCRRHTNADHTV